MEAISYLLLKPRLRVWVVYFDEFELRECPALLPAKVLIRDFCLFASANDCNIQLQAKDPRPGQYDKI